MGNKINSPSVRGVRSHRVTAVLSLCAIVAVVTATARAAAPSTITASGGTFRLDGEKFFPVMGSAGGCPDVADPNNPSLSFADEMAALGVNMLRGPAFWCGNDPATEAHRLHTALAGRMLWYGVGPGEPLSDLPEAVAWEPSPKIVLSVEPICSSHSSLAIFRNVMAKARSQPVISEIPVGAPAMLNCYNPQTIENVFFVSLIAGAKGLVLQTGFPDAHGKTRTYSVPEENRTTTVKLVQQLKALTPTLLNGVRINVVVGSGSPVRAGAWRYNGKLTIVAVNTSDRAAKAVLEIPVQRKATRTVTANLPPFGHQTTVLKLGTSA